MHASLPSCIRSPQVHTVSRLKTIREDSRISRTARRELKRETRMKEVSPSFSSTPTGVVASITMGV